MIRTQTADDGSCVAEVYGCMDSRASNYAPSANRYSNSNASHQCRKANYT